MSFPLANDLPTVEGRRVTTSIAELEHRLLVHLAEEQDEPLPSTHLIGTLCEAVRLCREYADSLGAQAREA